MDQEYFLMSDAARVLGCKPYQISYLLATRAVPEPARIGGRRVFVISDLVRISEVLKIQLGQDFFERAARRVK